jgi:hypothetical protein
VRRPRYFNGHRYSSDAKPWRRAIRIRDIMEHYLAPEDRAPNR